MSVLEIIRDVITESGIDDLDDNPLVLLNWMNRYKLNLQRKKRLAFSDNSTPIQQKANVRSTSLPSDYLSPLSIRRRELGLTGITQDLFGNQFTVTKDVTLHRWINREEFLNNYPINNNQGGLYVGITNNYMIQGNNVIWGPIPKEDESLYIDYYRLLPKYNLTDVTEDDFTRLFEDGLFARCMEMIFTSWIYDTKKKEMWRGERIEAESGIMKYQILREHPMESDINLPDN